MEDVEVTDPVSQHTAITKSHFLMRLETRQFLRAQLVEVLCPNKCLGLQAAEVVSSGSSLLVPYRCKTQLFLSKGAMVLIRQMFNLAREGVQVAVSRSLRRTLQVTHFSTFQEVRVLKKEAVVVQADVLSQT